MSCDEVGDGAESVESVSQKVRRFLQADDGPTAIEYALLGALIIAVCVLAVDAVGTALSTSFNNSSNSITNATSS